MTGRLSTARRRFFPRLVRFGRPLLGRGLGGARREGSLAGALARSALSSSFVERESPAFRSPNGVSPGVRQ